MKTMALFMFAILAVSASAFARGPGSMTNPTITTAKGMVTYSSIEGIAPGVNKGTLMISGDAATSLYRNMTDKSTNVPFSCQDESGKHCVWQEQEGHKGKNIDCRINRITRQVACIIEIADFTRGEVSNAD